tara:strand:+ start:1483 stop:1623 length:141 start_codon:yes stop_codon:yes gene_type:complete
MIGGYLHTKKKNLITTGQGKKRTYKKTNYRKKHYKKTLRKRKMRRR